MVACYFQDHIELMPETNGQYCKKGMGEILDWTSQRPRRIQGQILKLSGHLQ